MRSVSLARLALVAGLCLAAVAAVPSGAATSRAATFGTGTPTYVVSAAPRELPNVDFAAEPSLGMSWKSGNALFMANTSTYKLRFDDRAQPPTVSWSNVSSPYSLFNMDPILATDPATGVTLAGGDDGACAVMSRTQDDGESWTAAMPCTGVIDHPTVGLGPFHSPVPAGAAGTTAAYFCQQYPILNQCSRSVDGGGTWSPAVTTRGCAGLFGHVKVGPDGTAIIPSNSCYTGGAPFVGESGVGGFLSRDNGLTWSQYVIPNTPWPDRGFDPSVAIGLDGTVFQAWTGEGNAHPMVAVSNDGTAHWGKPVDLAATVNPPLVGSSFSAAVAGGPGRAAVAFLGTQHEPKQGVSPYDDELAVWHLYVSMTYDGGATWKTTQVTTDPVQRGPIADGGTTAVDARNLLDFIDAGVTREGRVVVAFADGCTATTLCTVEDAPRSTSTAADATVAYQASGRGLFAQYDR
ncbi:MAG: exo-alpha-sialidase [Frankiaceae bacterium]|nr:exo-alpha-sialidase [Frankiaceae bacterium]